MIFEEIKKLRFLLLMILVITSMGVQGDISQAKRKKNNIKLNKTSITLRVGNKKTLKLKGATGKIYWNSNKKKIAKVGKRGVVTGVKKGSAHVTALHKGKKYTCQVTVKKKKKKKEETPAQVTTGTAVSIVTVPAIKVDPNALKEVHTGQATWYGTDKLNGYTNGCAGLTTLIQSELIDDIPGKPLYICALNVPDFRSGLQGAYIRVTDSQGESVDVMVADQLDTQAKLGDVDLDRKAFPVIEPLATGRIDITWRIIPYPTTKPIQYVFQKGSNQWWSQIQVRNHRYPIVSVEYKKQGEPESNYKELTKTYYNYYTLSNAGLGPFDIRVTDILGDKLTDTVTLNVDDPTATISGTKNFPY